MGVTVTVTGGGVLVVFGTAGVVVVVVCKPLALAFAPKEIVWSQTELLAAVDASGSTRPDGSRAPLEQPRTA